MNEFDEIRYVVGKALAAFVAFVALALLFEFSIGVYEWAASVKVKP